MKFYYRIFGALTLLFILILAYVHFNTLSPRLDHLSNDILIPENVKSELRNYSNLLSLTQNEGNCHKQYSLKEQQFTFQPIDSNRQEFIYSAFYDNRHDKKVVVISTLKVLSFVPICIVWFSETNSKTVKGSINVIPEGSGRLYTASYITCPLDKMSEKPKFVSISMSKCGDILNIIRVNYIDEQTSQKDFAVCVTPFNLKYDKTDQLIEMISLNQLLGASHIYFYNYSMGPNVDKIINVFVKENFVTVLPWHLPMKVHIWPVPPGYVEEIKYFGQMAMLNDCLYRTMGGFRYTIFADLDEYLIPRQHRNWPEMFEKLVATRYSNCAGWLFRNIFFKTEWPSDPLMEKNLTITNLKAMSLLKIRREKTIYSAYQRSKMIVRPMQIGVIGVHNIWSFMPGAQMCILQPDEGLCHHYRFWDGLGEQQYVEDKNIFRIREDIVKNVKWNRQKLNYSI